MVAVWRIFPQVILLFVIILALWSETGVEARRGGGFRSSRGSTRVRVRVRQRQNYRSGFGTRNSISSGTYWKTAAAVGVIYGLTSYKRRSYYHRHRDRAPTICINRYDFKDNGTLYTRFICPKYGQSLDYNYCCGQSDRQDCCRFRDNTGRMAGSIIGAIIFFGLITLCVWCCCCRSRGARGTVWSGVRNTPKQPVAGHFTHQPKQQAPFYPAGGAPAPAQPGYPVAPQPGAMPPAPGMMPPASGMMPPMPPYGTQPAAPYPPQPDGGAPYPVQPQPYGEKAPYPPGDVYPPGPGAPPPYSSAGGYPPPNQPQPPYPPQ